MDLSFDSSSGTITGIPTSGEVGVTEIQVGSTNAKGTTDETLLLVIETEEAGTSNQTMVFEDQVSPSTNYQTTSNGISMYNSDPGDWSSNDGTDNIGIDGMGGTYRSILAFDTPPLPPGAVIIGANLVLHTDSWNVPDINDEFTIDVYKATPSLTSLDELNNGSINATNDSTPDPSVSILSSLTTTAPNLWMEETFPTSSSFVSLVQNAVANGTPLFFLIQLSADDEANSSSPLLEIEKERMVNAPELVITYTLPQPPLIVGSGTITVTPGQSFYYEVPCRWKLLQRLGASGWALDRPGNGYYFWHHKPNGGL